MNVPYRSAALAAAIAALGLTVAAVNAPLVSGQAVVPAHAQDWDYVSHTQCKVCHNNAKDGAQSEKWQAGPHAKALELLKSDAALAAAKEVGLTMPPSEAPECLKCHVTGYDAAAKAAPPKIAMTDGIQCESCHGPASEHLKDAKVLKFTPAKISEIDIMAHLVQPTEETCRGCHNDSSPTWKNDRYTLENGEKVGFDFKQAWAKIAHDHPAGVMEDKYGGKYPTD
jgi:nitrate/TMAO reductase-like tetraheme cytochrome c subunit